MFPTFIYGTAWKEDATERLTRLALDAGFRAIDTANQRRHYFEAGVGAATDATLLLTNDVGGSSAAITDRLESVSRFNLCSSARMSEAC